MVVVAVLVLRMCGWLQHTKTFVSHIICHDTGDAHIFIRALFALFLKKCSRQSLLLSVRGVWVSVFGVFCLYGGCLDKLHKKRINIITFCVFDKIVPQKKYKIDK